MTTKFDTQWIVGFVDGEGCFNLDVHIKKDMKWGIQMQPEFTVVQIEHDVQILHALKAHFGCGSVTVNRKDVTSTRMQYKCKSVKDLKEKILPFFEKHQLKTKKGVEFKKFREIVNLMHSGYHNQSLKNFLEIVDKGAALRIRVSKPNSTKPSKRVKVDEQLDKLRAMSAADTTL
jgi:LAGLIDADG endonuclease